MDVVVWIIPLIALAVFILSSMVKNKPEEPPPRMPPVRPRQGETAEGQRRTPQEIDRFLEEVRRRKRNAEQPSKPPPLPPPPRETPRPVPRRSPPPERARPPERPRVQEQPRPRPSIPQSEPEAIPVAEVLEALPVALQAPAATSVSRQGVPVAVETFKNLLRNRKNLAAAIMLKEVLDAPLCKRRGR